MSRPPPDPEPRRLWYVLLRDVLEMKRNARRAHAYHRSLLHKSFARGGKDAGYSGSFLIMAWYICFLSLCTNGVRPTCISYIKMPRHHLRDDA